MKRCSIIQVSSSRGSISDKSIRGGMLSCSLPYRSSIAMRTRVRIPPPAITQRSSFSPFAASEAPITQRIGWDVVVEYFQGEHQREPATSEAAAPRQILSSQPIIAIHANANGKIPKPKGEIHKAYSLADLRLDDELDDIRVSSTAALQENENLLDHKEFREQEGRG